jgi:hypothetical protein
MHFFSKLTVNQIQSTAAFALTIKLMSDDATANNNNFATFSSIIEPDI